MRIGVIDSDAIFQHPFFYGKKIEIKRMNPGYCIKNKNFPFSHAEYVCACILLENPTSEILLYNIIGGNAGNEGELLYRSLEALIEKNVDKVHIIDINNLEAQKIVGYYDKLFIDIDKYSDFMSAKKDLLNFVYDIRDAYKHCYIRYPFLGYYDRYRFLTEKGILIEQLYF